MRNTNLNSPLKKKATNNPVFWNPLNSTAFLQKVFSDEFLFWKGGGQCRLNPRKQSRSNNLFMAVHGKEVTQLRQITESIWRHWFQEHWGLQSGIWCSCTARNFNLHKHIILKNTICSNSKQFCLSLQYFFVVKRTCEATEDIFSSYFSQRPSKNKKGFHHK